MFAWWHNIESVAGFNGWMQVLAMIGAALTTVSVLLLWAQGNRLTRHVGDREVAARNKIKAVEKAAEQIRKELLATQQSQDIVEQKRRLAEMDAGALRKEMDQIRKRYADAEGALKNRIDELKDINTTRGRAGTTQPVTPHVQKEMLDSQQRKMLVKLLSGGPKGNLDFISVLGNPASYAMANELKALFEDQGWAASEIIQSAFSHPAKGLVLLIHSKATAPSYAKFLQRTLTTAGFPVSAQVSAKYPEWSMSMIVGEPD